MLGELRIFRNALGVKLEVDPLLQAHFADGFDVARTGTKRQTVDRVEDLLVLTQALVELAVIGAIGG